MPRIPTSRRQVQERAVNPGSVSARGPQAAQTNLAAQTGQLVGQVGEFVQRERNKAMDTQLKEMELEFIAERDRALVQGEEGFLNKRGKNTSLMYNDYNKGFSKFVDERVGSLSDPELRERANLLAQRYKQNFTTTLDKHTAGEMERHYDQVTKDAIEGITQSAVINYKSNIQLNDMGKVNQDLENLRSQVSTYADNKGMTEEQKASMSMQAESNFHTNIVKAAIQNGDDLVARDYYLKQKEKGKISGEQALGLERLIDEAVLLGESQDITGQIISQNLGMQESLDLAKDMAGEDPKLYDAVRKRVKNRLAERETIRQKNKSQLFQMYSVGLEQSRTLDDVKKTPGWLSLDQRHRQALEAREAQLAKGQEPTTDQKTLYRLKLLASAPNTKQKFMREDLMLYRSKLSDADFQKIVNLQADLIEGGEKGQKAYRGMISKAQIQKDLLKDMSLDDDEQIAFRARLDEELEQWSMDNDGKTPSNTDIREIGNRLLKNVVIDEGFIFDTKKRVFELSEKQIQELGIDEVPETDKNQITEILERSNMPVTDAVIVDYYRQKLRSEM